MKQKITNLIEFIRKINQNAERKKRKRREIDLKSAYIVIIAEQNSHRFNGLPHWVSRPKHHTHVYQSFDSIRPEQAKLPGDGGAPVVTDEEDLVETEGVEEGDEVTDDVDGGVAGGGGRGVGIAVPAEVGGDGAVSEGGESEELVAP